MWGSKRAQRITPGRLLRNSTKNWEGGTILNSKNHTAFPIFPDSNSARRNPGLV
jgi:hypothetical protein